MHFDSVTSERRTLASGVAAAAEQAGCQDQTANGCRAATHEQSRAASVVPLAALHVCPGLRLTHHWGSAFVCRMLHRPIPSSFMHDEGGTVPQRGWACRQDSHLHSEDVCLSCRVLVQVADSLKRESAGSKQELHGTVELIGAQNGANELVDAPGAELVRITDRWLGLKSSRCLLSSALTTVHREPRRLCVRGVDRRRDEETCKQYMIKCRVCSASREFAGTQAHFGRYSVLEPARSARRLAPCAETSWRMWRPCFLHKLW